MPNSFLKEKPVDDSNGFVGQVNSMSLKEELEGQQRGEVVFTCLCNNTNFKAEAMNWIFKNNTEYML